MQLNSSIIYLLVLLRRQNKLMHFVTGGAGYVGALLLSLLLKKENITYCCKINMCQ